MQDEWNVLYSLQPDVFKALYQIESINFKTHFDDKFSTRTSIQPGRVAQSVTCLATDACLTADPGVASSSRPGPILSWRLIMK